MPPEDVMKQLTGPELRTQDRVELVIACYCRDHGGNAPSMAEIAKVLHIKKAAVEHSILQLIATGRAERIDGKLSLIGAEYRHSLVDVR
jgi:hypothetical protein